ncbi:helix-turn-helix domain-containing protein [Limosilactobacillus reuteri]|jgi:transcriptional regulator with XRE-family HTH domain|uniref:helix-turn-helix domain-containing protein n=1 Tax=Limosilactobacillus reuteri TaxID=1598 RepID=UPI001CBD7755|nr:helix-turn-helix domain-containing protein [Limosilactobacillus reuteri]UAW59551.1 helix-turn-helix domain-containing protein [Limosilactobacillus reuteri]
MSYTVDLQLIKNKRQEYGYTMQDMAGFLGLKTRADYYKRENGDTRFRTVELPILSNKLHTPISHFFNQKVDKIETK